MRDYGELLRRRLEFERFQGYLTDAEKKDQLAAATRYHGARDAVAHSLLDEDQDAAAETMRRELDTERPGTPDDLLAVVDLVEVDLLERLDSLGRRSPWQRRLARRAPLIALAAAVAAYGGVRLYSSRSVDAPLESRAGIEQRAAALRKAVRYADWTDTRRHRLVVELVLWPIAPNAEEERGAGEFVGLVMDGRRALADGELICGVPPVPGQLGEAELALVGQVADAVLAPGVRWATPPVMTLLPPIRQAYPCQ